jgi:hypothetical protein
MAVMIQGDKGDNGVQYGKKKKETTEKQTTKWLQKSQSV